MRLEEMLADVFRHGALDIPLHMPRILGLAYLYRKMEVNYHSAICIFALEDIQAQVAVALGVFIRMIPLAISILMLLLKYCSI